MHALNHTKSYIPALYNIATAVVSCIAYTAAIYILSILKLSITMDVYLMDGQCTGVTFLIIILKIYRTVCG